MSVTSEYMGTTKAQTPISDDDEIRQLFGRFSDAWTRGDANAFGETFTPDVDYVPYDGTRSIGRQAVVENHDRLFPEC